ncbi:RNA polymerase I-specific transcription-initiation factor-domain-containing protein [Russula ochroleuca]|uniref:RNA polymerase I-specific transcription-initiation factor-domain-containing protein n=1 Tax=Russula ochroleuca TaxID=152965 RepID=A0A9P5MTG8_9AGAM|nr:RNA polymerase I-specific transcription-initiation factor-domain-containing protein [Russula ochroleuca]
MDTWPSHTPTQSEKGKVNAALPYPLLQGGALTSATLRDEQRRFEWVTPQNRASRRKLVCNEETVLAFPATRSPQLHQQTTSLLQRAEQGAHYLRTYYPDVDVPAELIREHVGEEARLEDSLCAFDPLVGDLLTSFHVSDGSKRPWGFMAFPMGESGCDLNFSSIEFSAEGKIITEPSHYPAKKFETPIRQIVSSPASSDFTKETVVGVRTFSSTSLSSLSLPTSKQSRRTGFIEVEEIDSINTSKLDGHVAVDVQIHSSLEYATLVNDQGNIFRHTLLSGNSLVKVYGGVSDPENITDGFWRIALGEHRETCLLISSKSAQLIDFRAAERGVQVYSVARGPDLCTSIETNLDDGLSRLVTTSELIWIDPRFHITPVLAWKHEREYDRTLSSHAVGIGGMKLTVLSSRNNSLLSVYDVSSNKSGLLQSHALPYSLSGRFPSGAHAGFYVAHPHPESDATAASLVQLTSRGGIYQTALVLRQDKDTTPFPATVDVSWSSAIHRLANTCSVQPDIGKLGARVVQEVDFRQAYQRLFFPLDATEAVYPAESAGTVDQTLDMMPLFWQEASTAHEHLLTTFDIAFRSGEEPTHASRADFLTQSALSSRRGFRALTQGRIPRELLIKGAAWYINLEPILQKFLPDISGDVQTIAERLRQYDLVLDDYRSGSSLRRESEAREQLAVDLVLSTDVYSGQSFAKEETGVTGDDGVETMSRAAEAMSLSETGLPSVHFGCLSPIPTADHHNQSKPEDDAPTGVALPPGVRLLLGEWDIGTNPDQYAYRDPYNDQQPTARATSLNFHSPIRDRAQATPMVAPPVIAYSRTAPTAVISSSQPITRHLGGATDSAGPESHTDSQLPMASTQILPGRFGGRLPAGKKKGAAGKRVGGF